MEIRKMLFIYSFISRTFIYFFESQSSSVCVWERDSFHLLIRSHMVVRAGTGQSQSRQCMTPGCRGTSTWIVIPCFPGTSAGSWVKSAAASAWIVAHVLACVASEGLACCTRMLRSTVSIWLIFDFSGELGIFSVFIMFSEVLIFILLWK